MKKRNNNILFIFPYFSPQKGAASRRAFFTIKYVSEIITKKIDVLVVCNKNFTVNFPERNKGNINVSSVSIQCYLKDLIGHIEYIWMLFKILRRKYSMIFISCPPTIMSFKNND